MKPYRIGDNKQKYLHGREQPEVSLGRKAKKCACGEWFSVPACHADRHQSCSEACGLARVSAPKKARERPCLECGKPFIPRTGQLKEGHGRFCSQKCGRTAYARTDEAIALARKLAADTAARYRSGELKRPTGPDSPSWRGGREAAYRRALESGKLAAQTRAYRAKNPHKMREWSHKRYTGAKFPRLPWGTTQRILALQKNLCANCRTTLDKTFHLDHIVPLAKGGAHEPHNLQALCRTCNVRKWAFDPIEWAQKQGRLL